MSERNSGLSQEARTVLKRIADGERLYHSGPYLEKQPSYYFATSGGAEDKTTVPAEVVNELLDRNALVFPSFSEPNLYRWTAGSVTEEGRKILASGG